VLVPGEIFGSSPDRHVPTRSHARIRDGVVEASARGFRGMSRLSASLAPDGSWVDGP
jgi:hypothetical protein